MGFTPIAEAPTPKPVNPISVIGVSITLYEPNLSRSPFEIL